MSLKKFDDCLSNGLSLESYLRVKRAKDSCQKDWENITGEDIQAIIVLMPECMMEAYERKNLATKF